MKCEECGHENRSELERALDKYGIGTDIELLDIFGEHLFPVYGMSGGITTKKVFYLIRRYEGSHQIREYMPCWCRDAEDVSMREALAKWNTHKKLYVEGADLGLPEM
jgi:hypothetical protein